MRNLLKNHLKKLIRNEQGNALVLVAISLVALCGFTALVVDGGSLFLEKSKLQKGLDAAVLAGAQQLTLSDTKAVSAAIEVAGKNQVKITASDIKTGSDYIQISKTTKKDLTFANVLGSNSSNVQAIAKAQIGGALKKKGVVPVGIEQRDFKKEAEYQLNFDSKGNIKGNFGYLAIDGSGGNQLEYSIKYGTSEVKIPSTQPTETGGSLGNVKKGFQYRIDQDAGIPKCNSYETADASCHRVIFLPIVENYSFVTGKSEVNIIGFAAFWINSPIKKHVVNGQFINIVTTGDFSQIGDPNDFGIYKARIVK